jgi:teichuronic acid biosynthesis glycosyltransferase TuaC
VKRLITFTNLFPSEQRPTHGLFVLERMARVAAELGVGDPGSDWDWSVIVPVSRVPRVLRWRAVDKALAGLPGESHVSWPQGAVGRSADGQAPEPTKRVRVQHVPYLHVPGLSETVQAARIERACRSVLERECADAEAVVLDAHYTWPDGVAAVRLAERAGIPCTVTARGSDVNVLGRKPMLRARMREELPKAAALFAVSEPLRRSFAQVVGVDDDRVELVRNGVDLGRFRVGDEESARRGLGLPLGVPLVLTVGRLTTEKGIDTVLEAVRKMPKQVQLVSIGVGPLEEALREGLGPDRLHLLGARPPEDVAAAMQACDVLAFPSHREGWPNVVTEALACGLPVVATPVGAVPRMLDSPFVGSLVRVGDATALARECVRILQRPNSRARIRTHAEQFGWQEPIELLTRRFEALVDAAAPRRAERG